MFMLIILEGLDRSGKSSVANYYESKGFNIIHQSAPPKGQTADNFLEEMMELVSSAANKDILLDRSYYGEACIWPKIYNRESLLPEENIEILREIEVTVGVKRILMYDPNSEAHWQRCVDNKEPLTKTQFIKARTLYSTMADTYEFERKTIKDFPEAVQPLPTAIHIKDAKLTAESVQPTDATSTSPCNNSKSAVTELAKTNEQIKLEKANVINEVLSKRLIKDKGPMYDEIERGIRHFLNGELGKIFGKTEPLKNQPFDNEEVELLKFFCKRLKNKEGN